MTWHPEKPYNELPVLPPDADLETAAVLKQCVAARVAIAELKQAAELIPNQDMLINTLPVLEARGSSAIENIVTTSDKLFQFTGGGEAQADPATKEALRCRGALYQGWLMRDRPMSTSMAETVCTWIKGVEMTVRTGDAVLAGSKTGTIISTPPTGEDRLRSLLSNWENFLHKQPDLDPLVRMAVMHYQFEAIHPFTDGNGRTGRILNILYLVQEDLLTLPILYLSRYILETRDEYYDGLLAVTRDQAWEDWLLYMLRAVEDTAKWTTQKIHGIRNLFQHTTDYVRERLPKIYTHELVEAIFQQPYCRIGNLTRAGIARRQTASRYLRELAAVGILTELAVGREKLFIHPKLVGLLTRDSNKFELYGA